jgi:hypothetical protein
MRDYGGRLRATREFAAARGWTLLHSARSDAEQRALLEQLHGEPFHPPERAPDAFPYPVLGRCEHRLSNVMRGTYRGRPVVVFAYARRQEVLDDSFGRRGWESSHYWIAALLDLPVPEVLPDLAPVLPEDSGRRWRISGTSLLTWKHQSVPGIPLDQVDIVLERLSVIAGHLTAPT